MDSLPHLVTTLLWFVSTSRVNGAGTPINLKSLGPTNNILTFQPPLQSETAAYRAIDGISPDGTSKPEKRQCPGTGESTDRWIQIDLKHLYLVQSVRVSSRGYSGNGVTVQVGSSFGNYQCGDVWQYSSSSSPYYNGSFRTFTCSNSHWTQYVVIRGDTNSNESLEICEVQVFYMNKTDTHTALLASTDVDSVSDTTIFAGAAIAVTNIFLVMIMIVLIVLWRRKRQQGN